MTEYLTRDEVIHQMRGGAVVALPSDTVYGLAALLESPEAIATLFLLKRRPATVALPVVIGETSALDDLGVYWGEAARRLSDEFWPGALTIVVAAPDELARRVGASTAAVGFRLPDDEFLRGLARELGVFVLSSANEHGAVPCHSGEEVRLAFRDSELLGGVFDGGVREGEVSSVVDVSTSPWQLLRRGSVSEGDLERVLG